MTEIRITNVNPNTKAELENIAGHLGIDLTSFLKPKLKEIADSYTADMKVRMKKKK